MKGLNMMNTNELKGQLDAAWQKCYELEDMAYETAQKLGKESSEYAKVVSMWTAARQKRDELDAKLTRKNGRNK